MRAACTSPIFVRCASPPDDVEVRGGVLDANGVRIECDDAEKEALKGGAEQCWWVRWVCLGGEGGSEELA